MADDRMKNDDLQRDMAGTHDEGLGQQTPGRSTGQQGGQQSGGQHTGGYGGSQKHDMEDDDEFSSGSAEPRGGMGRSNQGRGSQGRGGQNV
jgi:hypothetical protein